MARCRERLYSGLVRIATRPTDFFRIPPDRGIELGDRAGADRSDIGHRVEHGFVAVEDLLVAADPDRHLAAGGAAQASR
jgi:hypothetical protein